VLNFVLIFYLVLVLIRSPFERFSIVPIDGSGLNPNLQSFWMIIHPPIVFLGYVFVLFAFALTLARMSTGNGQEELLEFFIRGSWLLLTLGIALGGVWAYEVLGWGGYWAWDPIETGSLLPWLALIAYFHLQPLSRKGSLTKEFMVLIAFNSLMFLSSLTRGGFRQSVHAYAISPAGPILLLFALSMTGYFYLKRGIRQPLHSIRFEKTSLYSISFSITYLSIIMIFCICFFGIILPIIGNLLFDAQLTTGIDFYNNWNFPFVLAFISGLIGYNLHEKIRLKHYVTLIVGAFFIGAIFTVVRWPTSNYLANIGIPFLVLALISVTSNFYQAIKSKNSNVQRSGQSLLHLAIVLILLGVFVSSAVKQVDNVSDVKANSTINTTGLTLSLQNFRIYNGTGRVQLSEGLFSEHSSFKTGVFVEQSGMTYQGVLWIRLYSAYGIVSSPLIISTPTGDIYLHIYPTESIHSALLNAIFNVEALPESLSVTVEVIPMVYLVWVGVSLLVIGVTVTLIHGIMKTRSR
jgi:cytochrome c-type biogenesis protein CcmF